MDIGRECFPVKVVRAWHRLPREGVAAPFPEVFKARLDEANWWKVSLPIPAMELDELHLRSLPTQSTLRFCGRLGLQLPYHRAWLQFFKEKW